MSDPNVRWLVVRNGNTRVVERYLYSYAHVIEIVESDDHPIHVVLIATPGDADYSANYQSGRLASGMMPTTIHDSFIDAVHSAQGV